jgi:hypothetical protein
MIRTATRALTLSAILAVVFTSHANGQVIFAASGGTPRNDGGKVVGISLNSFGQTITSLGFYDQGQDGIATSYQLGLWDGSQNLLATATVTPSSPLTGDFRYAAIPPVTIGTPSISAPFTIGVLLPPNPADAWLDHVNLLLASGFTGAGTGQFSGPSGTLVYPSNVDTSSYYVVNANGPAPPVPEPATALLAAIAIISTLTHRKRR